MDRTRDTVPVRDSELQLDLILTGSLWPRFAEDGQAVEFYNTGNFHVIHYVHLQVRDDSGRELPANFEG
ncbi:hypothetical protein JXQ70_07205 [bacterium]|nr:hypothetical protein [bacterium]